jgi:DNA polymerase-1
MFNAQLDVERGTGVTGFNFDEIDMVVLCGRPDLLVAEKHNFKESRKHVYRQWSTPVICTWDAKFCLPDSEVPELGMELLNDIVWGVNMVEEGEKTYCTPNPGEVIKFFVGWDIETTGLDYWNKDEKILTSVVYASGKYSMKLEDHAELLKDPSVTVIGHNIKFDYNWWASRNYPVKARPFSTDVAAFLLDDNASDNTLEFHTTRRLQLPNHKTLDRKKLGEYPITEVAAYNIADSQASYLLHSGFRKDLDEQGLTPYFNLMMDVLPVFSKMEVRGIQLDVPWTMRVRDKIKRELQAAEAQIPVDNPNSDRQVAKLLFEDMGITPRRVTETGQPATNKEALKLLLLPSEGLKKCQTSMIQWVLDWRKVNKLWTGYFKKYPELVQHDGRIHATYAIAKGEDGGAGTGRTSCRNPNLQNIPNRSDVRGCYCASFGYKWGDADYSGLEMVLSADLSGETKLIEAIKAGHDFHTSMMARMYNEDYEEISHILATRGSDYPLWKKRRTATKRVNFGILFGISAKRLHLMLLLEGIYMSVDECQDLIDQWLHTNANLNAWLRSIEVGAREHRCVTAVTGAKRRLPGANRYDWVGSRKLRQATNFPIQHTASALLITAMVELDKWFEQEGDAHLLMNVHDQVAFEFKGRDEYFTENVKRIMEVEAPEAFAKRFGYEFTVPFRVDLNIDQRWT